MMRNISRIAQWWILPLLLLTSGGCSDDVRGDMILSLYDALDPGGYEQRVGYEYAVERFNNLTGSHHDIQISYHSSQCGMVESDIILDYISDDLRRDLLTSDADGSRLVIVGGCCQQSYCQHWFPQITCSHTTLFPQPNLIPSRPELGVILPALTDVLHTIDMDTVCLLHSDQYSQELSELSASLAMRGISVTGSNEDHICTHQTNQVYILLDDSLLCELSPHLYGQIVLYLSPYKPNKMPVCDEADTLSHVYMLTPQNNINIQIYSGLSSRLEQALQSISDTQLALYEAACSYDSMMSALFSMNYTSSRDGVQHFIHNSPLLKSELISSSRDKVPVLIISLGAPGAEGESGDPGDAGGRLIGTWDPTHTMSPLNLTVLLAGGDNSTTMPPFEADYDRHLVALGVMSSFAFLGIVYSSALIAFNCSKSKDRIIKLTSPNINLMTCLGSVLSLLSTPLLGIERPITSDLDFISSLQQAAIFILNIGQTIIISSILVKTWRVHRIFKKMHLSSKGTKDEHLLLMIIGLSLIEVVINTLWLKLDHIQCHFSTGQVGPGPLLCLSEYQLVWSFLLSGYKIILLLVTLFYAWHVRHVKLPSLQDSQFILTNSLVIMAVIVLSLPVLSSPQTTNLTRLIVLSLSSLIWAISSLTLLLTPKIFLVRKKETKSGSAVRFLFGESLKKHKEKDEIQSTGCFARLKLCNNQSESNMGDSILSQEIEALKHLVKEKDDTIRELTDRLFFGADRFKAYVNEKTTSSRSNQQTATDNYYTTAGQPKYPTPRSQLSIRHQTAGSRRTYNRAPPLASPSSSVDSGTVEDIYTTPNSARRREYKIKPGDTSLHKTLDTSLSPIREMSVGRELSDLDKLGGRAHNKDSVVDSDRSVTPTTDSAINMSQSSSEDEQRPSHRKLSSRRANPSHHIDNHKVTTELGVTSTLTSSSTIPARITTISSSTPHTTSTSAPASSTDEPAKAIRHGQKSKPVTTPRRHLPARRLSDGDNSKLDISSEEQAMYKVVNRMRQLAMSDDTDCQHPINDSLYSNQPIRNNSSRGDPEQADGESQQLSDSCVGDEIELEIVFPRRKTITHCSEL